uniref:Nuclease HARBI1-like n=1 Tax=Saccoglossus kowalevskii TaxID=10224 RepID=A0ABM0GTA1_SACKO|nr:PREDICTED: putative nuclease HARBI1-like [Saccoglossus kowalevskii]
MTQHRQRSLGMVGVISELFEEEEIETDNLLLVTLLLRDDHVKINNFWEYTVPQYQDRRFRRAFRVPHSVFEYLADILTGPLIENEPIHCGGRPAILPDKKIAIFLKCVGSMETILDIAQLFNITESSVIKVRRQVTNVILIHLLNNTIHWPLRRELQGISACFNDMHTSNLPNIIGAVDGSHIPISTPHEQPDAYYNRKKFRSVVLQGVCREDLQFIDVSVGCPGRMHDARVLRNSTLWNTGMGNCQRGQYHVIGDAAYPLTNWLMTPYRDNGHLDEHQRLFNTSLSRRRVIIERAFGSLKRRFRRLLNGIDITDVNEINKIVLAACIIHNICIKHDDIDFDENDHDDDDNAVGVQWRQLVADDVVNDVIPHNPGREGRLKRINLTYNL